MSRVWEIMKNEPAAEEYSLTNEESSFVVMDGAGDDSDDEPSFTKEDSSSKNDDSSFTKEEESSSKNDESSFLVVDGADEDDEDAFLAAEDGAAEDDEMLEVSPPGDFDELNDLLATYYGSFEKLF